MPWWIAVPLAALGGWCFDLANPDTSVWPLVFPSVLLILAAWWQQRPGVAMLAGLAAGSAFWLPHISWLTLYLGPIPWLALSTVMVAWFVLQGLCTAWATRGIRTLPWFRRRPTWLLVAQALTVAGVWVLREGVQGVWPYGGFPWGRVAHVLAESPLSALVSWVGFAGLSAVIVVVCAAVVGGSISVFPCTSSAWRAFIPAGVAVAILAAATLIPVASLPNHESLRVAAIQGNSKSGIFDDRENGDVFADHVRATEELLDALEVDNEHVDVIVWPENAGEFALTDNPLRGREVALLSKRADAQIVIGTVLADPDGSYTNSSVVWGPTGQQQPKETSRYDKRFPVPFAEYMPNRDFFHALVPDLVDLVQLEYRTGTTPTVMPVDTQFGDVLAGIAICFDIIFDEQAENMVQEGAELILAQSNNADFGRTDENVQQLQIARLRAIETGRAVVNISTVGTSAIIAPDGHDIATIPAFIEGAVVADVPLVSGSTPALRYGATISLVWMLIGGAGLLAGGVGLFRLRRSTTRAQ
ncbi:apolipoprotein N-acyltransferase [Leucobacter denitrificans]|uniref:Apolipoprotein N-acyltransferase n=1 Tax=Leucobacter denitrificans TaxID=683042 RepID=A0A7G9S7M1_9MICO|nr:apolipoprotein N-acyltransferase [Leucobacter denitrificans]